MKEKEQLRETNSLTKSGRIQSAYENMYEPKRPQNSVNFTDHSRLKLRRPAMSEDIIWRFCEENNEMCINLLGQCATLMYGKEMSPGNG